MNPRQADGRVAVAAAESSMNLAIHGQQMDISDTLQEYIGARMAPLQRHFDHPVDMRVQVSPERPGRKAEATVAIAGHVLHVDAVAADTHATIDLLADKLDRRLMKHKEQLIGHRRGKGAARPESP